MSIHLDCQKVVVSRDGPTGAATVIRAMNQWTDGTRTRYRFGENWARYLDRLPEGAHEKAAAALFEHAGDLEGCTFLDAGCGSGLMSVAALSLGASRLLAIDYDPVAVTTAATLLSICAPDGPWSVERGDILSDDFGQWDVVYSWGVLHHTGDVIAALERAAGWTTDGGRFVVAIYLRTPMCGFWRREKRWYSRAPHWQRALVRLVYLSALMTVRFLKRWSVREAIGQSRQRGMTLITDADDWLGGYPYESLTLAEIVSTVEPLGFTVEAAFPIPDHRGWLGTGCQTIRFRRSSRHATLRNESHDTVVPASVSSVLEKTESSM